MSIEQVGAYSPSTVYGQFSSPFEPKNIKVNSHTPYDKEDDAEKAESASARIHDFLDKEPTKLKIAIEKQEKEEIYGIKNEDFPPDYLEQQKEKAKFPPDNVTNFSASSLSSKDIVNNAMKKGYSSEQAVVIDNAKKAYEKSTFGSKHLTRTLSKHEFKVS